MLKILENLCERGVVRQLDYQFARFIASIDDVDDETAFLACVLSHELAKGHICLDIDSIDLVKSFGLYGEAAENIEQKVSSVNWHQSLANSPVVGDGSTSLPLVFDGKRLYLHRYWFYENKLISKLIQLAKPVALSQQETAVLAHTLNDLFGNEGALNWQKVAAAVALTRKLAVISGGPGTGKTTTVAKILSALAEQGISRGEAPNIKLVAPTGKAAARLTESISNAIQQLGIRDEIKTAIPTVASTIHRLLGAMPNRAEFRHNQDNPLHLDLLVVDEASMVDLPLMFKLILALPEHARLILLGDKDQLSSVEAGAVLGDICSFIDVGYSTEQNDILSSLTGYQSLPMSQQKNPIADCLCMLKKSYRFDENSGIGQLAKEINRGDIYGVDRVLKQGYKDIQYNILTSESYSLLIDNLTVEYSKFIDCLYQPVLADDSYAKKAKQALDLFGRSRLLCAVRQGDYGIEGLNKKIESALIRKNKISSGGELWYVGRPVMVVRNDHALGLYNGDIGVCFNVQDEQGSRLKVFFELADGSIKSVLPSRVPEHQTAYAMTIHKSQGSEFEHTFMILPEDYSPILTRELIYTGVTRAKKQLTLCGNQQVIKKAVKVKTERLSGLKEGLLKA